MAGLGISLPPELLKDISTHQLSVIDSNDEEFFTFFCQLDLEKVREIQRKHEVMNNKNRELSVENTELRPRLEEKKEKLTNTCLVASEMKETYDRKYTQLKTMAGATDRASLHKELQQAMKTAEKESEDLSDSYMDGATELSSDEFINQFLSHRCSYWSRRVKSEKMEIIMKQPLPYPPSPSANQPIYATVGGGGQPPYPPSSMQSIPPYPPTSNNEAPPPTYNSLGRNDPTQSYSRPPLLPTASMPVPNSSNWNPGGGPNMGKRNSCPSQPQHVSSSTGGYPQASYRPAPQVGTTPPQASYRPAPQNYSQPPPQGSYRPAPPPPHGGNTPPQESYRPPPLGNTPPAVGQSYPIYQSGPYYGNHGNQYGGVGGGYPPRR